MTNIKTTQRDYSFDYMKGLLIFLVVLGHCPACLYAAGVDIYSDPMFVFIYTFHMPLFMLTTGYFFAKKRHSELSDLVPKQANRLLLPQFAWSAIALIIILLQFDKFGHILVGETTAATVKCIYHYLTSYWYLWCVFFCSIIAVIAYKTKHPVAILFGLSAVMLIFLDYLPDCFFKHQQVAYQLPFFTAGMLMHDVENVDQKVEKFLIPCLVGYIACWVVYANIPYTFGEIDTRFKIVWAAFGTFLFYTLFKKAFKIGILNKLFTTWGGYTWRVYYSRIYKRLSNQRQYWPNCQHRLLGSRLRNLHCLQFCAHLGLRGNCVSY